MKKIKFLSVCIVLLTTSLFTSCSTDVEPLDPAVSLEDCAAPSFFQASDFINGTSVNLSWVASGNEVTWEVSYGLEGFQIGSGTKVISHVTNLTINNLVSTNNYEFYVRAVCGENLSSSWVGPISVNSSITGCVMPVNLLAVRSTTNPTEVNVTWAAGESETSWEIQYGSTGFAMGTGTITSSNTTTKVVSGLQQNSGYDFYVRSICSDTEKSGWLGPINVPAVGGPVVGDGFMNATINGTAYNNMKPFFYPVSGGSYAFINELYYGPDVLQIQGNSSPLDPQQQSNYEINLLIPRELWAPGTYALDPNTNLQSEDPLTTCMVNMIIPLGGDSFASDETGTITITEFNFTTRRIKGTFSYSYKAINYDTSVETGPFQVTNGTFDFPIDPEDDID